MAGGAAIATGRLAEVVPALAWARSYRREWLAKDALAGVAAGAVVIPQAMAYASIASLPVEVGLYTCMTPMLVYVALGGSRSLSVSTTSTVAVLTATTLVSSGVAARSADPARALATLSVLVGAILLVARLLRLGRLIDNVSDAALTGVKISVGLTIAAGQLPKLLGVPGDPAATAFVGEVAGVLDDLGDVDGLTAGFAAVTIAALLGISRWFPRAPAALVAVVGGVVAVAVWSLDERGLALIDAVPSGLPTPVAPELGEVRQLLGGALAIAAMAFIESASAASAIRRPGEPQIDNDRELLAGGLACTVGGLFRAMPSSGGFSQSATNSAAGAVTQLSEVVTALLAVGCALFLGGVLSDLPQATLGSVVFVAVGGLIRPAELRRLWRLDRIEFWIAVGAALAGLAFGLLEAVVVGVALTLFSVLRELDHVGIIELQLTVAGDDLVVAGPDTVPIDGLLVLRFEGPLYTANVRRAFGAVREAVGDRPGCTVVLDTSACFRIPVMVLDRFADLERELAAEDVRLWVAAVPPGALEVVRRAPRWRELQESGQVHPTALAAVRRHLAGS